MYPAIKQFFASWVVVLSIAPEIATAGAAISPDGVSQDEIRIGMVNAQSGPASGLGRGMREGAQAVFDEVNAAGGVHGRQLRLIVADDGYEPERTVAETLSMIQEHQVFSLLGFVGTPTTNAALPLIRELNVPLVGVLSGAGSLRSPPTKQLFNTRVCYDDEVEALVAQLITNGARSVAVVYQFDGFGVAVLAGTEKALKRRGMAAVATGSFQRNTVAVKTAVGTMLESQPAVAMAFPSELAGRALTAFNLVIFLGVFAIQWGIGLSIDGLMALGTSQEAAYRLAFTAYLGCCVASYVYFMLGARHN